MRIWKLWRKKLYKVTICALCTSLLAACSAYDGNKVAHNVTIYGSLGESVHAKL